MKKNSIAIVGGGVAGASVALYLSQFKLDITLFEKESSLVSGPPMCHLHAGGNLYREIDDKQCIKLLKQSIELLRFYPHAIDFRPTLLVTPKDDKHQPLDLLPRLQTLQSEYERLIQEDERNKVLGQSSEYFKIYTQEAFENLKSQTVKEKPSTLDEWFIPVAKELNFQDIKFPIIAVQEYGLNVFRIAASSTLRLQEKKSVKVKTDTFIKKITRTKDGYNINGEKFDYLINAAGFRSGMIDDMLQIKRKRLVEFKAAYICKWDKDKTTTLWPEVIFYGERGTPQGMAQFTPYPDGYFQLHGMTHEITLFKDGLAKSSADSSQPKLERSFLHKLEKGWHEDEVAQRTKTAINYLSRFIPSFQNAQVASKPLFGAQQVPGEDITLRASEVSFEDINYARCEIVKASSILTMADAITKKLIDLKLLSEDSYGARNFIDHLDDETVTKYAKKLCVERNYPESLACVNYGVRERI